MVQVNVDENGQNILGDAANEPCLAIDPVNPQNMVIGWRQFDNVMSNFRQAGYGYTSDGGQTWTFPGAIEPGIFRSDPVLDSDSAGGIYYNSLTSDGSNYFCKVFKSTNGGSSWDAGTDAYGGDKQWMVIDKSGGTGTGNIYSVWNSYYSSCYPGFFIRSVDNGNSYLPCTQIPGNPYWGTMAVGNNGEVYVTGTNEFGYLTVARSLDAQYGDSVATWYQFPINNLFGSLTTGLMVNPSGLTGQVNISVDKSNGPGRDNIYVLTSFYEYTSTDTADIYFIRSTDGGVTWDTPVRVNDDETTLAYQWLGTMSVAPNGRIDAIWLDTRDNPDTLYSALYYSYSLDQGLTWSVNQRLSPFFDSRIGWPQQAKMGDYFYMISDENHAYLAWANTLNGEQDVWFSTITPFPTAVDEPATTHADIQLASFPNPFSNQATVRYDLPVSGFVTVTLRDLSGRVVKTLENRYQLAGSHNLELKGNSVASGYYMLTVTSGNLTRTIGLVKGR